MSEAELEAAARSALAEIASGRPLLHHLTNFVTANDSANLALAYGALPVMAPAPEEAPEMASGAQALVLNLGTLNAGLVDAMAAAGQAAAAAGVPIVLDPVGAGATRFRTESAHRLLAELPVTVLRGNRGEVGALLGSGEVRGVEATGREDPGQIARAAHERLGVVVAVTGAVDVVVGPGAAFDVYNGHPLLAAITGSGCMATTAVAALVAAGGAPERQAALALATYGLAAERAAEGAPGPGTFRARLFDEVAALGTRGVHGLRIAAGVEH
jgi:hydroxyethylthiazole kinase